MLATDNIARELECQFEFNPGQKNYSPYFKALCRGLIRPGKMNFGCNVAPDFSYVYMEVPKAASTSILNVLQHQADAEQAAKMKQEHERHLSPLLQPIQFSEESQRQLLESDASLRFTFVRNPYSRLLSAYLSKVMRPSHAKRELLAYMHAIDKDQVDASEEMTFEQFVDVVASQGFDDMNSHWLMQTHQTLIERIDYDFIGKFENLAEDFRAVAERLYPGKGVELKLTSKVNTDSDKKVQEHYTPELKDKVYQKFYEDFQAFGYSR